MRKNLKLKDSLILLLVGNTFIVALFDIMDLYIFLYMFLLINLIFYDFFIKYKNSKINFKKQIIIILISTTFVTFTLINDYFKWDNITVKGNKDILVKVEYDDKYKCINNNNLIRFKVKDYETFNSLKGIKYIYAEKHYKWKYKTSFLYIIRFKDFKYYESGILLLDKFRIEAKRENSFLNYFGWKHNKVNTFLEKNFNRLSWSIVTGNSNVLKMSEKKLYKTTGTAHLFAVSGLHLGFIFLLSKVLLRFSQNKRLNSIVCVFFCFLYCSAVGFPQSAVRAFIMVLILETSSFLQIKTKSIYALCWTLVLVVFSSSYSILSLSFQLSFTIVAFIILFVTRINRDNFNYSIKDIFFNYLIISIACYLGSFYLIYENFGYFSKTSILVNSFISPLVFTYFCLSFINIILFFLFDFSNFYYFIEYIYIIMNSIIQFFDSIEKIFEFKNEKLSIHGSFHLFLFLFIILLNFLYLNQKTKFFVIISFYICTIFFSIL